MENQSELGSDISSQEIMDKAWAARVFERFGGRCAGCGGDNRLQPRPVVPVARGKQKTLENSVLLCFACDNASGVGGLGAAENDRLVDVHVSQRVCNMVHAWTETGRFSSMSAGLRRLMVLFMEAPSRFSDLSRYQDPDPDGPKITFWVNREFYRDFQRLVRDEARMSVKDALIALILLYEAEGVKTNE